VGDQFMRVELENGMRFAANFRYNIKPSISKDPMKENPAKFKGIGT